MWVTRGEKTRAWLVFDACALLVHNTAQGQPPEPLLPSHQRKDARIALFGTPFCKDCFLFKIVSNVHPSQTLLMKAVSSPVHGGLRTPVKRTPSWIKKTYSAQVKHTHVYVSSLLTLPDTVGNSRGTSNGCSIDRNDSSTQTM